VSQPSPLPPGLQPERTQLAWTRTALSFGAITALMSHSDAGPVARGFLVALGVAGTAAVYVSGRYRQRHFAGAGDTRAAENWIIMVPALLTCALGVISALLIIIV
jgi:uncharacterized membrane protein YidH (DUF202 family)